jgi:hypothetical protein
MMNWEQLFGIANTLALASWATLIAAPRHAILLRVIRYGVIGLFCLAYSMLVMLYFFRVDGGGFGSLHEVKVLFTSDPVVLAVWLHYLAFDLFVGLWIAQRADALDISRLIQGRNLHVRPRRIAGCERHRPVRTPRSPDRIRKSHVIDIRSRSSFNLFDCRSA